MGSGRRVVLVARDVESLSSVGSDDHDSIHRCRISTGFVDRIAPV